MNFLRKATEKLKVSDDKETEDSLLEDIPFWDIKINSLSGIPLDLSRFQGKYLLIVNVASKCGFTKQYEALQKLSTEYKSVLTVIGVPCNQFGNQESGSPEAIQKFCSLNYNVSFPLSEKLEVKGPGMHPLYQWLTNKASNKKFSSSVKWNFQKYLLSPKGELIDVFYSITKPTSTKIVKHFNL